MWYFNLKDKNLNMMTIKSANCKALIPLSLE